MIRFHFPLLSAMGAFAEDTPRFMPEGTGAEAHPLIAAIKVVGMVATAIFVIVMVIKSIKVVKHDEDDRVDLPD